MVREEQKPLKATDGVAELIAAALRLRELDIAAFSRVLSLCRAYVAPYDSDESDVAFASRLSELTDFKRGQA